MPPVIDGRPIELTDLDRKLLPALTMDGRATYPELAHRIAWSESALRRRLQELRRANLLRFDVEIDAAALGFRTQCLMWLTIPPAQLAGVAAELVRDPETAFVGATTGASNLMAVIICRDESALFDYITGRIGTLGAIDRVETVPITAYAKRTAPGC